MKFSSSTRTTGGFSLVPVEQYTVLHGLPCSYPSSVATKRNLTTSTRSYGHQSSILIRLKKTEGYNNIYAYIYPSYGQINPAPVPN